MDAAGGAAAPQRLDANSLVRAVQTLARRDPALRRIYRTLGPPPLWQRAPTFATLVRIVIEQQVSLAAAASIFGRLELRCGGRVTAMAISRIDELTLKSLGMSRNKARYVRQLADEVISRRFSVAKLGRLSDDLARQAILSQLGFGPWSADVYLMMALLRPDILPLGDLGLVKGIAEALQETFESPEAIASRAEAWRPWRSVATRMIWQLYLSNRGKDIASIASAETNRPRR